MGDNVLALPHRNLELSECMTCDAGLIWQWWGMCRLRNYRCLVSIVPMEIIVVAVQKYRLHCIRGKRRLFCSFLRLSLSTQQYSIYMAKVLLFCQGISGRWAVEWIATQQGPPPSISLSFWLLRVKSVPPLVLSSAATWVLCSGFEDGVRLMHHHRYYCYCYYLFAPKASVVVGFLLSFELYSAAEFLDWMKVVWWG